MDHQKPTRFFLPLILAVFLTVFLAGCGGGGGEPDLFQPGTAPWAVGETHVFQVTNLEGQVVGEGRMEMQASQRTDNVDGWLLARTLDARGEYEASAVELSAKGYRPKLTEMTRRLGQAVQHTQASYAGSAVEITLTTAQDVTTYERVNVTSDVRDERSLLYIVRSLPLTDGYMTRFNSFLPVVGQQERITLTVLRTVDVTVPAGAFAAWEVRLETANGRVTSAWIGQEDTRPILKFIDGRSQATYDLMQYEAGK